MKPNIAITSKTMGIDFDILEHCKKVRADHGPPYACPVDKCGRTYKSVCGLQYHLKSYDHDNPTPIVPATPTTPKNKKGTLISILVYLFFD